MRVLAKVSPSPEQLKLFGRNQSGLLIIRGAAGSGKTTTALLRLRALISVYVKRRQREGIPGRVKVLVLTFNKTLRGYIKALAEQEGVEGGKADVEISTFAKWARNKIGNLTIINDTYKDNFIKTHGRATGLGEDFLIDEIEYVLGRFLPAEIDNYVLERRDGRGSSPRVER